MLIILRNLLLAPSIWHPDLQSAVYIPPVFLLESFYFLSQTARGQQWDVDVDSLPALCSSKDLDSELSGYEHWPQAVPKLKGLHTSFQPNLITCLSVLRSQDSLPIKEELLKFGFILIQNLPLIISSKLYKVFSSCSNMELL